MLNSFTTHKSHTREDCDAMEDHMQCITVSETDVPTAAGQEESHRGTEP